MTSAIIPSPTTTQSQIQSRRAAGAASLPASDPAFLGVGWGFPFGITSGGEPVLAVYEEDIRQAIRIILGTDPGERVMRPEFGAGLRAFLFEPISPLTRERLRSQVENALIQWEPRIDVLEVRVEQNRETLGRLDIAIDYRVRASNSVFNLVYPFYLQEGSAR